MYIPLKHKDFKAQFEASVAISSIKKSIVFLHNSFYFSSAFGIIYSFNIDYGSF